MSARISRQTREEGWPRARRDSNLTGRIWREIMTTVIISILLWASDVTFGWRDEAAARGARDRADTGDEICAIPGEDTRESTCNVNGRKNKL